MIYGKDKTIDYSGLKLLIGEIETDTDATSRIASLVTNYGAAGDFTDDTEAWQAGIAAINAGEIDTLLVPERTAITSLLDPIAATGWAIRPEAGRCEMRILSTAGTLGTFFTIGSATTSSIQWSIRDLHFRCVNTPDPDAFAVDVQRASNGDCSDIIIQGVASILRLGGPDALDKCTRNSFRNWKGDFNNGEDSDSNILIRRAAVVYLKDWDINCTGVSTNGAMVRFAPVDADAILDTFYFNNFGMMAYTVASPSASADGKPYGMVIEHGSGDHVTNIWFDSSWLDQTTTAAVHIVSEAAELGYTANINFRGARFMTSSGEGIVIDNTSGTIARGLAVENSLIGVRSADNAVRIVGSGYQLCRLTGNRFQDSETGTSKAAKAVIDLASDGWEIDPVGSVGSSVTNLPASWGTVVNVSDADVAEFRLGKAFAPDIAVSLAEPTYTVGSALRHYGESILKGSATFNPADLADGAGETTTVTVTGAALGDYASASFSLDLAGIILTAWVSAANTVSVRFQNESGGSVNLGSGTLRALVRKV